MSCGGRFAAAKRNDSSLTPNLTAVWAIRGWPGGWLLAGPVYLSFIIFGLTRTGTFVACANLVSDAGRR